MRGATFRDILEEKLQSADAPLDCNQADSLEDVLTVQPCGPESTYDRLFFFNSDQRAASSTASMGAKCGYPSRPRREVRAGVKRSASINVPVENLSAEARIALVTLGIEPGKTISQTEVRRAFHRLAKRLHPDVAITTNWQAQRDSYLLSQEAYDLVTREILVVATAKAAA